MGRKKRINLKDAFYHVTLRGNDRKTIFYNDYNRCRFCLFLQEASERNGHKIHAFCLMGNHIHLLIQASKNPIAKTIHSVAGRYAKYLNKYTNSVGHQFEKRYHSKLIQDEVYLLTVFKYIHLNPVRAKLTSTPEEYYWSSHNCYSNRDEIPWLITNDILSMFSEKHSKYLSSYKTFMSKQLDEKEIIEIENPSTDNRIIGTEEFVKDILQEECPEELVKELNINILIDEVCKELDITRQKIFSTRKNQESAHARAILSFFINEIEHLKLVDLARLTKKSSPTLSKQAKRISNLSKANVEIAKTILNISIRLGIGLTC